MSADRDIADLTAWMAEADRGDGAALRSWTVAHATKLARAMGTKTSNLTGALKWIDNTELCSVVIRQAKHSLKRLRADFETTTQCLEKPCSSSAAEHGYCRYHWDQISNTAGT